MSRVLLFLLLAGVLPAQTYDLLLQGGHVIDPANQIDRVMDVAISGNKIARVAEHIPSQDARKTVDVSGLYVTPGLIDLHAHVFGYEGSLSPTTPRWWPARQPWWTPGAAAGGPSTNS